MIVSIELVVTDLDGTLWDDQRQIREETRQALAELAGRGIPVLAATARGMGSTTTLFSDLGLSLPAVYCNGAFGKPKTASCSIMRRSRGTYWQMY
jgi:hydroxymethylpyrimidine pyrophosphatase-like HAD family hydrolase